MIFHCIAETIEKVLGLLLGHTEQTVKSIKTCKKVIIGRKEKVAFGEARSK